MKTFFKDLLVLNHKKNEKHFFKTSTFAAWNQIVLQKVEQPKLF